MTDYQPMIAIVHRSRFLLDSGPRIGWFYEASYEMGRGGPVGVLIGADGIDPEMDDIDQIASKLAGLGATALVLRSEISPFIASYPESPLTLEKAVLNREELTLLAQRVQDYSTQKLDVTVA